MQQLTEQTSSLGTQAFARLLRAYSALTRELSAQLVAEHQLTISEYEVLLRLARAPERSMRRVDLAAEVLLSPSGITRLLDRLEAAGLVEKASCASDARVTYAVLSEAGLARLREVSPSHVAAVERLVGERLDEAELATLVELLGRLPGGGGDADCASP
jgi:DNA-binding MarR family transcriptional regulator